MTTHITRLSDRRWMQVSISILYLFLFFAAKNIHVHVFTPGTWLVLW